MFVCEVEKEAPFGEGSEIHGALDFLAEQYPGFEHPLALYRCYDRQNYTLCEVSRQWERASVEKTFFVETRRKKEKRRYVLFIIQDFLRVDDHLRFLDGYRYALQKRGEECPIGKNG